MWSSYSDAELEDVLRKVELWEYVSALDSGLNAVCEPETAFSQGQRQLFCLARICLRKATTRILVIDEATSRCVFLFVPPPLRRSPFFGFYMPYFSCTSISPIHPR